MPATSETGFYGKLPCRGDFMQRRAPQGFVDTWDAWLQECLHASREQLGAQWLDVYLTSPIWRFVLAEGICGESAYAGVMLPSVDRVGRYFPLTILAPLEVGTCLLEAACGAGRAWFDAAQELALKALDAGDLDVQAFDAEVDALRGLGACEELAQSNRLMERIAQSGFARGGSPWHVSAPGETPQRAVNAFASLELQRAFRPCALWWTEGSEQVQPGWLVTSGLPSPTGYVAMLCGQWRQAGWNSIESGAQTPQETAPLSEPTEGDAAAPRDVQIIAAHPAPRHELPAAVQTRYIERPEIGLWGVVTAAGGDAAGARADLIADVAHDLAPQATLTALMEATRRALRKALAARTGAVGEPRGTVAVVLFLSGGTECALAWSGAVRAVRIRGGAAVELLRGEPAAEADAPMAVPPAPPLEQDTAPSGDGGLLALLATPAVPEPDVNMRYEELAPNDLWVLAGDGSVPDALLARLASTWPEVSPAAEAAGSTSPLLLVAARIADPTAA